MLKRIFLAGLLAASAVPALASDASLDKAVQSATTAAAPKADSPAKHDCACCQK